MSIIFAKNPRGLLPSSDVAEATEGYMRYRRAYNSDLAVNKKLMGLNLRIVFFQLWNKCPTTIDRLVSMGLGVGRLLFQVRPKVHQLEHLQLSCMYLALCFSMRVAARAMLQTGFAVA